jgi:hypothetical protein
MAKLYFYYLVNIHLTELNGYGDMIYRMVVKFPKKKTLTQIKIDAILDTYFEGDKENEDIIESIKENGEALISMGAFTDAVVIPYAKKITKQEYDILKKFLK